MNGVSLHSRLQAAAAISLCLVLAVLAWFGMAAASFTGWSSGWWAAQAASGLAIAGAWGVGVALLGRFVPCRHPAVLCCAALILPFAAAGVGQALTAAVAILAWMAAGDLVLRRSSRRFPDLRDGLLSVAVGLALYVAVLGVLVRLPVNSVATHLLLWALPLLANARGAWRLLGAAWDRSSAGGSGALHWCLVAMLAAVAAVYAVAATLPDVSHDANALYYPYAHLLTGFGRVAMDPGWIVFSPISLGTIWPLLSLENLGGPGTAKLADGLLLATAALLLADAAGRRLGRAIYPPIVLLLLLATPVLLSTTANLHSEIGTAVLLLAGCLLAARGGIGVREALAAGLLLGAAVAAKPQAILAAVPLGLGLAWSVLRARGPHRLPALALALAAVGAVAAGATPYAWSWVVTGNPVFPFMNQVFRAPGFPPEAFKAPFTGMLGWSLPVDMALDSSRYMESGSCALGFQHLLLGVPAALAGIAVGNRLWRSAGLAFACFAVGASTQIQYLRYYIPILPLGIIAWLELQHVLRRWRPGLGTASAALALVAALASLPFLASACWPLRGLPLAALGDRGREAFVRAQVPEADAARICALLDGGGKVLFLDPSRPQAGRSGADFIYNNWYFTDFSSRLGRLGSADEIERELSDHGVARIVHREDHLERQTPVMRSFLRERTRLLATVGPVSIREVTGIPPAERPERIRNGGFTGRGAEWNVVGMPRFLESAGVEVDRDNELTQVVAPVPSGTCRLEARLVASPSAAGGGQARLQVNWLDARGGLVRCDIRVVEVGPEPAVAAADMRPPPGAVLGVVYVCSHGSAPVRFLSIGLR